MNAYMKRKVAECHARMKDRQEDDIFGSCQDFLNDEVR